MNSVLAALLTTTIIIIISTDLPSAFTQLVRGDYLVRIPQGATQEGEIHYDPAEIAVPAGATLVWFNDDPAQPHTVTSGTPDGQQAIMMC